MAKDGAQAQQGSQSSAASPVISAPTQEDGECPAQLTKADLEDSLSTMCEKLAGTFQSELHKATNTLPLKNPALGGLTDLLETKHNKFALANADLRKDYGSLAENFQMVQSQVEDLDNGRNNLSLRGIPEAVTDLPATAKKLFHTISPSACHLQRLCMTGFIGPCALNLLLRSRHEILYSA